MTNPNPIPRTLHLNLGLFLLPPVLTGGGTFSTPSDIPTNPAFLPLLLTPAVPILFPTAPLAAAAAATLTGASPPGGKASTLAIELPSFSAVLAVLFEEDLTAVGDAKLGFTSRKEAGAAVALPMLIGMRLALALAGGLLAEGW